MTVRRGGTLWSIAAAHLPVGADAADVDWAWRALYADNRDRLGPDPDPDPPGRRAPADRTLEED